MWLGGIGLSTIEDIAVNFTPIKLQGLSNLYLDPNARLGMYLMKSAYILHI